jgi:UDP-glucose 4-epimerase
MKKKQLVTAGSTTVGAGLAGELQTQGHFLACRKAPRMRMLVTGGAGFIGSNLVQLLLKEGHDVTVLDNLSSGHRINLRSFSQVRLLIGDVRDPSMVEQAVNGVEVVFHLAASVGSARSIEHPIIDAESNVLGTINVLESARRNRIRKIVFSSSAAIFGELKTLPITEDHCVEPDSSYGATKLCAEKLCLAYGKLYDVEPICLRYFNVFGVNQRYDAYGNAIPIFAHKLVFRQPITIFGDGEQTRDFINVRDVAKANYLAGMSQGVSGAFNVGSGSRVTINELVKKMETASGLSTQTIHGSPRRGDVRHSLADISRIRSAIGFKPQVSLEEGLREYMNWAKVAFKSNCLS